MQKKSFKSWGKAWNEHFEKTRDRVALLGDGHKEINIRDKDSVRKYMSMAGTTIVNSIRTNFKVTE